MKDIFIASNFLLLAGIAADATAIEPSDSSQTIIVTATRTAQSLSDTLASTTVITRQDIETQQAKSVQDVLRGVAGIDISSNGGAGQNSSMFMRGSESDHVVFLVDGIKVGSATAGTQAFQMIPIENVERIEIVRGPMSSLYGSDAIGGVVQVFTRTATAPFTPSFSAGVGSNSTQKINAGISGRHADSWYSISASHEQTDGFDACAAESATGFFGCYTDEPDDDAFRNESVSARAGHRFGDTVAIEVSGFRTKGNVQFDGEFSPFFFVPNEMSFVQQNLGTKFTFTPSQTWKSTLSIGQSLDLTDNRQRVDDSTSFFDTTRETLSWQNDLFFENNQTVTIGLDYQDDEIDSDTNYAATSRDNKAVFAQYQTMLGRQDLQVALRRDDNEQFGDHSTGNIAWGFKAANQLRFTASYGTAFKAPTFNELYFPFYGNPDVEPESSKSLELGLRQHTDWGNWSAAVFRTDIDDLIAYDSSIFLANNISKATIVGLEASATVQSNDWNLSSNITLQDPENRDDSANLGNQLPRRAASSLRVDADRKMGLLGYGITFRAVGKRYDDIANTRKLEGYATLDLRISYRIQRNWLLEASADNVLNKDYEVASGYNTGGDLLFVGVRYSPTR